MSHNITIAVIDVAAIAVEYITPLIAATTSSYSYYCLNLDESILHVSFKCTEGLVVKVVYKD